MLFRATIVHTKSTDYKITTSLPPTIVPDSECGSTKGCQSDCNTGTCSYQVTWKRSGDLVRFEFQQLLGTGNKYQAVGLSNDSLMVNLILIKTHCFFINFTHTILKFRSFNM